MTESVRVATGRVTYDVRVGSGLLDDLGPAFASTCDARRVAQVSDGTVDGLLGDRAERSLRESGIEVERVTFPAGEASKTWSQAGRILELLAEAGLDRTDAIVALGGGVVGDLAGFCAAVFLRGIALAHVPTTLLAQVDSSIGGKTGVDLPAGKNLAGSFVQPKTVVTDPAVLSTLSDTEWTSGLAEIAKAAVLDGEERLGWLEANAARLVARDEDVVEAAVLGAVRLKARVVSQDEFESGLRECLNLGHTLGHALEAAAGYGSIPHGHAVAEGMRFAAGLGLRIAGAEPGFAARVDALLDSLGLAPLAGVWDPDALRSYMSSDKKARGGRPRFVLAVEPGRHVVMPVDEGVLAEELDAWASARGKGESSE